MNETVGQNGLCPVLLVFGVLPRMPPSTMDLPKQRDRMKALKLARLEMSKQVAKERLRTAHNSNVPAASDSEVKAGDKVFVYREEPREWLGPYLVLSCEQKQVIVDIDGTRKPYSIDKVKIYYEPVPEAPVTTNEVQPVAPQSSELGSILEDIIGGNVFFTKLREKIEREVQSEHITDRTVKVLLIDVLKPRDPREDTQEFDDAKQKEINGLLARGKFCPIRRRDTRECEYPRRKVCLYLEKCWDGERDAKSTLYCSRS